jgi:hypothetical protein
MPRSLRDALAEAAERVAPGMTAQPPGSARISNKQLNCNISRAVNVEVILDLVDEHHKTFDFIHVCAAVTRVAKLAKATRDVSLASDGRYAKLMGLVVQQLPSFDARGVVNVFSGLATLQVKCGVAANA